jgi:von Willebrand factor type A C-terminal domain/von Willebrand factor type A domain
MTDFSLEVFQNEYVAEGSTTMDAIVTVSARGGRSLGTGEAAEVLVIDTSGSMGSPPGRILAARQAAREAIDTIRDGTLFAVVAGNERATTIFPAWGSGLVVADATTRAAAREAVRHLKAGGGTAMSTWLHACRELFAGSPSGLRHVILLTDGENWEDARQLDDALEQCRGEFQVDCRGVGTDWVVDELRTIASVLLGTVDIIPEPEQMAAEFRHLMEAAMGRAVARAELRVWCPQGAAVNFLRQVAPEVDDLTRRGAELDARTLRYPLGAWGSEARDYHLSLSVPPNEVGVEMLAARVNLVADDILVGQGLIRTVWTEDEAVSTRIAPEVAHYTGQAELSASIREGLDALKAGDDRTATVKLGQATRLAVDSGHDGTVRLLKKVVEVEDERTGTVRLRKHVDKADEMALDTRSTRTVRVRKGAPRGEEMALDTRSTRTVRVGAVKPAGGGGNTS